MTWEDHRGTLESAPPSGDAAIDALRPWFHNLHLPDGRQTSPSHKLGDFPRFKWLAIAPSIPDDLTGWSVLDVGCNAGFYSFELAARGASVTGIDLDEHYLDQARWAAGELGLEDRVTFRQASVYDAPLEKVDLVWFMGVFYHLRYPLLALDLLAWLARRMLVFQSLTTGSPEQVDIPPDLSYEQRAILTQPGWPSMAFIERRFADDPTNWWVPNAPCVEAILRSAHLRVIARPDEETYVCEARGEEGGDFDAPLRVAHALRD